MRQEVNKGGADRVREKRGAEGQELEGKRSGAVKYRVRYNTM